MREKARKVKLWDPRQKGDPSKYVDEIAIPQLKEIIDNYQPKVIWFDTGGKLSDTKANERIGDFIKEHAPNMVVNPRLRSKRHIGDFQTHEQSLPAQTPDHLWELSMSKKILFVMRHAPYGTSLAREALEATLAACSFEQQVSVLFLDDGVLQLVDTQQPASIEPKNHNAMLQALPLYDIDQLYVEQHSATTRQLSSEQLPATAQLIDSKAAALLMADCDHIVSF